MKDKQSKFRVGCFNGELIEEDGKYYFSIRHDSMDEPLKVDYQEIHDLSDILSLIFLRMDVEQADGYSEEHDRLNNLIYELEA